MYHIIIDIMKKDIKYINDRIENEICYETINKLKDIVLIDEYKECKSVKIKLKN